MHLPALILLLSAAAPAHAKAAGGAANPFGSAGQLALTNDFQATVGYVNIGGSGSFELALLPAADYFIARHFSIGGQVGLELLTGSSSSDLVFWVIPRVGYAIPLGASVSLWPRLGPFFQTSSLSVANGASTTKQTEFGLSLSIPVLFHLSHHLFIGAGPAVNAQLTGDVKETTATVNFTFGGWL